MTVQELIDEILKVEDKSKIVYVYADGGFISPEFVKQSDVIVVLTETNGTIRTKIRY